MFTEDITKSLATLKKGGIILYPTDTIWGIGCDAGNDEAVKRIYSIKQRADSKSMLVLLDDPGKLYNYVNEIPDIAWDLIEVSDKPITIIYPNGRNMAPSLFAEDGSIGIRITSDPFCKELIYKFRKPLISTSANLSGSSSPSIFSEISEEIKEQMDYIVEWRQDDYVKKPPSSVIKLESGGLFRIIRK